MDLARGGTVALNAEAASVDQAAVSALIVELERAFATGTTPDLGRDSKLLTLACARLIDQGRIEPARYAVRHLQKVDPASRWAERTLRLLDIEPTGPAPLLALPADLAGDVRVLEREGSDAVLLVFCGTANRLGVPIPIAHGWLGRTPASVVYLRDARGLSGAAGYPSLGTDRPSTVAALGRLVEELGASRVYTYGNSAGVFPAIHYGLALGADATLCMAGRVNLDPGFESVARSRTATPARVLEEVPDYAIDLRPRLEAAESPPRVQLVYGEAHADDRMNAEHLRGLPSVELIPIPGFDNHNVALEMILTGSYAALLHGLFALEAAGTERRREPRPTAVSL
jgi:hypothetical protein